MKKHLGIGLLELMLSLAIISVLLVMATRYYRVARQGQQVNDAISEIHAIIAACENWITGGQSDFTELSANGVKKLIDNGYLPEGSEKNPWHGSILVGAGENPNQVKITMNNIPAKACFDLAAKLNSNTASPQGDASSHCSDDGSMKKYEAIF